jgi:uncharacterized repeat protein (TIGR02543 family)
MKNTMGFLRLIALLMITGLAMGACGGTGGAEESTGSIQVTIEMWDSYGDSWNGAALRINVNGTNLSPNASVPNDSERSYRYFYISPGDLVRLYWVSGEYDSECAFAVYYSDDPPSYPFHPHPDFWSREYDDPSGKILIFRQYGSMSGVSDGSLIDSFAVPGANVNSPLTGTVSIRTGVDEAIEVTVDMWDMAGDGWDNNGTLRININGTDRYVGLPNGFQHDFSTFMVNPGDVVNFYWVNGSNLEENAFAVYYSDDPPYPAFQPWWSYDDTDGKVLLYRQYFSMYDVSSGDLLGSFTVPSGAIQEPTVGEILTANTSNLGGAGTISYQWNRNGTPIPGAQNNTYIVQYADMGFAITVTVTRSGNSGSVTSDPPLLVQDTRPALTGTVSIDGGEIVTESVEVTVAMWDSYGDGWDNSGALRIYIEHMNEPVFPRDVRLSSGYGPSYYTFMVDSGDLVNIYWVDGSALGENAFAVYYSDDPPDPAFQPNIDWWSPYDDPNGKVLLYRQYGTMDVDVSNGTLLGSFRASGSYTTVGQTLTANTNNLGGDGAISYQWNKNGTAIPNANDSTYVVQSADVNSAITVTVTRSGNSSSVTSNPITVIVVDQPQVNAQTPTIVSQPVGTTVPLNALHSLSVSANVTDGGVLSYQWYSNSSATNDGGTSLGSGAKSTSYNPPTNTAGTYHYFVEVTNTITDNGDGGIKTARVRSNPVEIEVRIPSPNDFVINLTSLNEWELTEQTAQAAANTNKAFTVTGTYTTYRWYLDGTQVGTSSSYTFNKPIGVYQLAVVVTNGSGESRSGRCWVTVAPTLTVNVWTDDGITDANGEDWYSFPVSSGTTYRIWWNDRKDGNGTKNGDVAVSARYENSTSFIFGGTDTTVDSGWATMQSFSASQTGRVFIRVIPYNRSGSNTGTYGIVFSTASTRPAISYVVTYSVNGGSGTTPTTQTANAGSSITLPGGSGLSNSGYTFGGWNTNSSGTGTNYAAGSSYTPTADITLYAKWYNYAVTFNANGASGTVATQMVIAGSSITLPSQSGLSRSGYNFGGWNTAANGSGTNYYAGTSYTPTGNVTLYARWYNYTVSFYANGGSGTVPSQMVTSGSSITMPSGYGLTRSGYRFVCWNNSSGTGTDYYAGSSYTPTYDITFYAKWEIDQSLAANVWTNHSLTTAIQEIRYSFTVTQGTTYRVWWNDSYEGSGKTLDIKVSARYSNGTTIFSNTDSGYYTPQSFTATQSGTVYITVVPYSSGNTGTYGIVYSTGTTRPQL